MTVKIGQVWESTDSRVRNKSEEVRQQTRFKVVSITGEYARVERVYKRFGQPALRDIRLDRFKPNSTGYKLVEDVSDAGSAAA